MSAPTPTSTPTSTSLSADELREEWRPVAAYPEYEISNLGALRRVVGGSGVRPDRLLRPLKPRLNNRGYFDYSIRKRAVLAHQLVAAAFLPPPRRPARELHHRDGNRLNNHPSNLQWVTRSEHLKIEFQAGRRRLVGESVPTSRLNEQAVLVLRHCRRAGVATRLLMALYGISKSCAEHAISGRTWPHVAF